MAVYDALHQSLVPVKRQPRLLASPDGLRLVTQVRGVGMNMKVLLLCPVSARLSTTRMAYEMAVGMVQMNKSPILILDLDCLADNQAQARFVPGPQDPVEVADLEWLDGEPSLAETVTQPIVIARPKRGMQEPVSLLSSSQFTLFVRHVRERFAYVLIDAPPVLESVLGLVVAPLCDGAILSVGSRLTTYSEVQTAKAQLVGAKANIIGFVLDQQPSQ